ncbi:MAG: hypothetical protein EBR82_31845, partial [Caulobacteraceae bacterium]|nr:hypothetical protein [Caulobacteraceae bacterium]
AKVRAMVPVHDPEDGGVRLVFDGLEEGVAPGQACVLYDPADPDRLLGGGFIQTTTAVV